eukprot:8058257-Pyramimonas_sp.AAC.1
MSKHAISAHAARATDHRGGLAIWLAQFEIGLSRSRVANKGHNMSHAGHRSVPCGRRENPSSRHMVKGNCDKEQLILS